MFPRSQRIYEFGQFQLYEGEGVLLKEGQPVPLTPKVFDTLLVLIEGRGHVVLKEEIMGRLWPDCFVEEVNVNRNISTLRRALSDSPNEPIYIETIPKRGYRFVAPVTEVSTDEFELTLERHTSAEIITEEEEIIDSASNSVEAFQQQSYSSLSSKWYRRALPLLAILLLGLSGTAAYYWIVQQRGHAAASPPVKSIAVLPFKDMRAKGEEHMGLSLADVLITRLSNLRAVNVRPTSAVLKFEQQEPDSISAGRVLGVDAVLEGGIYSSGEHVRVTARLLRVNDQTTLWSGQFEDKSSDVLAVQNAISEQVAESLLSNLTADERTTLTRHYSQSPDAYQLYARGRYFWNKRSFAGMKDAEYYFRRAIEKDPNFALAYLGLADTLVMGRAESAEAYQAITKAIELEPTLGEAYATRGFASMFHSWDWRAAEASFKRAIELSPGYGTAHQWYATLLGITRRVDEAKHELKRALEIDPTSANFLADLGQEYYFAHEYEQAESSCRKSLEVSPDFVFGHQYLFYIYHRNGRYKEALEEFLQERDSYDFDPKYSDDAKSADEAKVREIYARAGINGVLRYQIDLDMRSRLTGYAYDAAKRYALLGDKQEALTLLEKSYENKDFLLPFVGSDPVFDDLRSEASFQTILKSMNLPF